MTATRSPLVALYLVALVSGLWVAADGRHHWDEPTYLYAGAYVDAGDIIDGQVQPSGIGHFTQGRILHALIVKGVMQAAGSPPAGFSAMLVINLALLAVSVLLLHRILRALLPDARLDARSDRARRDVARSSSTSHSGVLADAEALCAALLATYALLRLAQGGGLGYAALAAASIAFCTLSKNQMAWMPATFWATFSLVPLAGIDRRRLVVLGAASGLAAIVRRSPRSSGWASASLPTGRAIAASRVATCRWSQRSSTSARSSACCGCCCRSPCSRRAGANLPRSRSGSCSRWRLSCSSSTASRRATSR